MESERATIAALIFIGLIVGANFVMYAIARGATRGDSRWMRALRDSISKPLESRDKSMDELRKKMEELKTKGDGEKSDSSS
ncbi:MAG: hypothetical protein HZB19_20100 [Chloroflexi bacterium]|nr:hypothetical protein [Chloroflexota bacterium]